MIATLAVTLLVESLVVVLYALWRKQPLGHLLLSSVCANLFTQSFLWLALTLFPQAYRITLFLAEIAIWGLEAFILYLYPYNRLGLRQALLLSLVMNLASFGVGWFLPV